MDKKRDRKIFYDIGKKYGIPWQIAEVICVSPFSFARDKIQHPTNDRPIMFAKLFKIKPRKKIKDYNFKYIGNEFKYKKAVRECSERDKD